MKGRCEIMMLFIACVVIIVIPTNSTAQIVTTAYGNYSLGLGFSGDGLIANNTQFNGINKIVFDKFGNGYVSDQLNHRIRKIDKTTMIVSTYVGTGVGGHSGDNGPATLAQINFPIGLASDSLGNLFFADENVIRRVDATTQIITVVAGTGVVGFSGDGDIATNAQLNAPVSIAIDNGGNIYIAENNNSRIRKINITTGIINTIAGNGINAYSGDNVTAIAASLNRPSAITLDNQGNLYIADNNNYRIRKVDSITNIITTIAGNGTLGFSGDGGFATLAQIYPNGLAIDRNGNILFTDFSHRIRSINNLTGNISTIAGNGTTGYSGDGGPATLAQMNTPFDVVADFSSNFYIIDQNNRIREVDAVTGIISNYAGKYVSFAGEGSNASNAVFNHPISIAFDSDNNLLIIDMSNQRIRKIDAQTNFITTIAGNGTIGFSGDGGQSNTAEINEPQDFAIDKSGNIFIADYHNQRVRKIDAITHIITTYAGNGLQGLGGREGLAINAELSGPQGIAVDEAGNVYIANWSGCVIDKVDAVTKIITTVAGIPYGYDYSGDGGLAINAKLYFPFSIAVDHQQNLYIADSYNYLIRKVDNVTKIISKFAGNGGDSSSGDGGLAINASVSFAWKLLLDTVHNNLYFSAINSTRKIDLSTNVISTIAGTANAGYSGDGGLATQAKFNNPVGIAFDKNGVMYVADYGNNVIRKITATALPLSLVSFTGKLTDQKTKLVWTTTNEINTSYFSVQRSEDGVNYHQIEKVEALQNNNQINNYSSMDNLPVHGANYYRLKMVDLDNKTSNSKVIKIINSEEMKTLNAYPNPTSDLVTIYFPANIKPVHLNIVNNAGKTLKQIDVPAGTKHISISLKELSAGNYFIQMAGNSSSTIMIVKQ